MVQSVLVVSSLRRCWRVYQIDCWTAYDMKPVPDEETLKSFPVAGLAYGASKILAHQAGTDFMSEKEPQFDLIRILPGYIQGANELYTSAKQMRDPAVLGSNEGTMNTALGNKAGFQRITSQVFLDDVAKAHVFALKAEVAKNGDNLLVVANDGVSTDWGDVVPIIEHQFPDAIAKGVLTPKVEDESGHTIYDVRSSEQALGFKFAGPEAYVKSVIGQYVGFVGAH